MNDSNNSMIRQDPYAFFPEFSRISISQELLLQTTPLVGDTSPNNHRHETPSEIDAGIIPVSSPPIVLLSPPDTNQDVFHTPPENPLLASSDFDVPHCTVNQAVDVDAESQVFVDLAGVSELGFPENSRCVDGDGLAEIHSVEFRVLEREISELGQAPVKKLKLGFDSLGNSNAVNSDDLNREIPVVEHSVLEENVETQAVQFQNAEAVDEGSGMHENPVLQMLQKELGSGKDKGKQTFSVFDVLKVLSDNSKEDEDEDEDGDGLTVLEAAKLAGITFPRPSWWPDHYVSKLFNFDDDD